MRLPGIDGDAGGLIDQMRNIVDGDDGGRAAEKECQMAFAMRMGAHRLVQPIDGNAAKGSMTDR